MKKTAFFAALVSIAVASSTLLAAPANAVGAAEESGAVIGGYEIPDGVVVDESFDPAGEVVYASDAGTAATSRVAALSSTGDCKDRAFTVVVKMSESLNGCSVIGATKTTKVQYKWYKHRGNANPCIWGKSFNSKAQPTWTELNCGTGRSKMVPWGNVAATKKMKGLTPVGWAGVQWQ